MGYFSLSFFTLVIISCFLHVHADNISSLKPNTRQSLEIIIGIGGGGHKGGGYNPNCIPPAPPPPEPKCPPPPSPPPLIFADEKLAQVYPVIQRFKKTITDDPLNITSNWVGSDICNKKYYTGYYCDNPPNNKSAITVASIDFNGYRFSAPSLIGFLEKFPDLALFHANTNNFTGPISPKIIDLPFFYELDLSNNKFNGPFPTFLLSQNNISFLDLRYNFFSGSVPPQIFCQSLEVLFINNNNFMQKLPDNLGNTPVFFLTLANNKFVGSIPTSIGKASATLIEVLFLNNQLSGCLPYEIGFLKNATVFDASINRLTGPIPCSFGCLEKIEQLVFAGNLLYGQIPEVVCALGNQNLKNFSLSDNYFTQVGPICRHLIKRGILDVKKNCIKDLPNQRSDHECVMFFSYPRCCPNSASYGIIPCKLPHVGQTEVAKARPPLPPSNAKAPSPSYAALDKHRT